MRVLLTIGVVVLLVAVACGGVLSDVDETATATAPTSTAQAGATSTPGTPATDTPTAIPTTYGPVLSRYTKGSLTTLTRGYSGGVVSSVTQFMYFEVTGGMGEVRITVRLEDQEQSITAVVEAGKFYKLSVLLGVGLGRVDRPNILTIDSPALASPQAIKYEVDPLVGSLVLSLKSMDIEEWEPPPPNWKLSIDILSGVGTVSTDVGYLLSLGEPLVKPEGWHPRYEVVDLEDGTLVTATAAPATGYVFDHWEVVRYDREYSVNQEPPSITIRMTGYASVDLYFVWEACAVPQEGKTLYRVIFHNDEVHTFSEAIEALVESIPNMTREQASDITEEVDRSGQFEVVSCPLESAELYRDRLEAYGLIVTIEPVSGR
ncbi:MAG: ATP-dependent Clp protease adaptor ClpS [Dehalococcoidia bacterium]